MGKPWINEWQPDVPAFWQTRGRSLARRNLLLSVINLVLSFSVWMLWSILVVRLPAAGFPYSPNQLFWLAALPGLSGALLRIVYGLMVPLLGGRRWTALSSLSLCLPLGGIWLALGDSNTGYPTMLLLALSCGLGGANFSSSLTHLVDFFPQQEQAAVLSQHASLANLGVPLVQCALPLLYLLALSDGGSNAHGLQQTLLPWIALQALAAVAAWLWMDDVQAPHIGFLEQMRVFRRRQNWLMSWLYLGSFGSLIGFAAAFPLLLELGFAGRPGWHWAFLGVLVGTLARALGLRLGSRHPRRILLFGFLGMALCCGAAMWLPGHPALALPFLAVMMLLFICTGLANAATFQLLPSGNAGAPQAVLAFASSIAALGAFVIPKLLGSAWAAFGEPGPAFGLFILFYLSCALLVWKWPPSNGLAKQATATDTASHLP